MGTSAHVVLVGGTADDLAAARTRLEDLEQRWSRFLPDSELSRLNGAAGVPVVVSTETYQLISDAVEAWHQTDGSFDPTIGTTMVAAGYDRSFADGGPSGGRRTWHLGAPGAGDIVLHPYGSAVHLPANVQLDLGGMAKGAAADLVAQWLLSESVPEHSKACGDVVKRVDGCLVNIGGDLRAAGTPPRPEGWTIDLKCPGQSDSRTVRLVRGAVCTSTKTKRCWPGEDGLEHHLRDPNTGRSLETGIASVTIIAARAAQAEVLTKAVFAAGPVDGPGLVHRTGATGLLVLDDGTITHLPGLSPFLVDGPVAAGSIEGSVEQAAGSQARV